MVGCMKAVLKIAELPGCPAPAQGGWKEHKRDEQCSAEDLYTRALTPHPHGSYSFGGPSALRHYKKSGVLLPHVFKSLWIQPSQRVFVVPKFLSGLLKNSRRAPKYASKTVREIWKGGFAKIFTM